ncbi:glycosyltransferase [Paraconexibacter sp. AEG42_29]|uniref:Glycosyltransferase n=1 Tax=Paraconexibacter sp. AEG42_29 TaxID=2997339 RepID=A0AAU7B248_9ACTN
MTNPPGVLLDARDAFASPLRGWGRYALELSRRLPTDLVTVYRGQLPGPQVLAEQLALPVVGWRAGVKVIHAPNCFLPLVHRGAGVVTVQDLAFEAYPDDFSRRTGTKYRWITPRAARRAARVLVPSQATADDLVTRYGIDAGKLRIVPYASSLAIGDAPLPPSVAGGEPYLLAVGDLRAKKNLARVVAAWMALRSAGELPHRLVVAGHGDVAALGLPAGAPLPDGLVVTGFLSDAELDAVMRGAALVVHASLYEGFGLVVAEALARGVPVAIADATSLPEVAGDAAERFDPLDVDDLAAAILRAVAPDRAAQLRALGLERTKGFSWQACADATADVYRELL